MDSEEDMHDANDVESVDDDFYSGETEDTPMDYSCSEYDNNDELEYDEEEEEEDDDDDDDANFDFVEDDADDSIDFESRRAEVIQFHSFLCRNSCFVMILSNISVAVWLLRKF
jgi:hypothetical protein